MEIIYISKTRSTLNCFQNALVGGAVRMHRLRWNGDKRVRL
jgi:hypothetical protein